MQKIKQFSLRHQILLWLPVTLYAAFIFYLSSLSETGILIDIPFFDKLLHAIEYAIFGLLLMRAIFGAGFKLTSKGAFAISVVVAFLYAITDEIHQTFVFGRSASISDALSDLIGSGLGSYFYLVRKL